MMFSMQDELPVVFVGTVQRLTAQLRMNAIEPTLVTVTFGEGTMDKLPRDMLRLLWSVAKLWDVPVEFPEHPGAWPGLIEVWVQSADHVVRNFMTPEELTASR